jgi:hypothetical protein
MRSANLSPRNSTVDEPIIVPAKGIKSSGNISFQSIKYLVFCATNIPPFSCKTIEKSKKYQFSKPKQPIFS